MSIAMPARTRRAVTAGDAAKIYINGRFLSQPITGVQRYAIEIVRAFDAMLEEGAIDGGVFRIEILAPAMPTVRDLGLKHVPVRVVGRRRGHAWEQFDLPANVPDGLLFCPANAAPLGRLLSRRPTVVTVHDLSYRYFPAAYSRRYRWWYGLMMPLIMKHARRVLTVSESERRAIVACYPQAASRLVAVANGTLEHAEWNPVLGLPGQSIPVHPPTILYVGALSRRKNFQGVLAAFEQVNRRSGPVRLVVVGSGGATFANCGFQIPDDLRPLVEFRGQVECWRELGRIFGQARCMLFPSFYESSGLPPIEAMSFGCPVLASRIPALEERCGDAALYCDPHQPQDIAGRLMELLNDDRLHSEYRRRGFEQAAKYSWANCGRETFAVLSQVVHERG